MRRIIGLSSCILILLIAGNVFGETLRGGKVVFWSYDTENLPVPPSMCVYVMNADGSDVTRLPIGMAFQAGGKTFSVELDHLSLSPDCQKVAFNLQTWSDNFGLLLSDDIVLLDLDSGEIVNLTNGKLESCRCPRWSPDGRQIVFHNRRVVPPELYIMDSDGADMKRVEQGYKPDWSPDGRTIAFVRNKTEIYTMHVTGHNVRKIAENPTLSVSLLRWSPDGKKILFTTANNDIYRTYIMDSDGNNLELIREKSRDACWSPDGKKIAFVNVDDENSWHCCHIWLMDPDGSGLERLTDNERGEMRFDWRDPAFLGVNPLLKPAKITWGEVKTRK